MLISAMIASFMGAIAKVLTEHYPVIEVVFFRSFFGTVFVVLSFFTIRIKQNGGKPFVLFMRAFFGLLAMGLFFYNVSNINLAEAVIYAQLSPIFIVIFSFSFLNEKINKKLIFAVLLGFVGMIFVMQPENFTFEKSHFFGFLNAICAAIAFTSIKELKKYYDTRIIILYFMLFSTIITMILMVVPIYFKVDSSFLFIKFIMPRSSDWIYIIGLGITSALAQVYMTKSYGAIDASVASAISYTVIIFSMILGVILGDSLPNIFTILGVCLIVFSGIIVSKRK